ncbi:XdhC family protein [Pantanalinema sp. GBBB05]|uniref:XdhC family protein n=1 Tax=Pantanalinema sp. GBBB05 TaxID=2604139 RepID=UPI001D84FEE8|nr:XdhC family protein [Pantanalinema sp. GBBB05]
MLACYRQLAQILATGRAAVLATVVQTRGSVPREVGAKMLICEDGKTLNTIGGGAGEAKVIQQARLVLQTGVKQAVEIDLTGAPDRDTHGVCGGRMQVWLERWSGDGARELVRQMLTELQAGRSLTVVTPFGVEQSPYCLESGLDIELDQAFVEVLQPDPVLLIVGAGHVGEQLAKVATLVGFELWIQDDRSEWANLERFPQATQIFTQSITETIAQLDPRAQLYIALVTRGYKHDLEALAAILNCHLPYQYLGMIGSKRRVQQVYQALQERGITASQLATIHAPIGVEIGALTPEEIAVSITAELIQVRRCPDRRNICPS